MNANSEMGKMPAWFPPRTPLSAAAREPAVRLLEEADPGPDPDDPPRDLQVPKDDRDLERDDRERGHDQRERLEPPQERPHAGDQTACEHVVAARAWHGGGQRRE